MKFTNTQTEPREDTWNLYFRWFTTIDLSVFMDTPFLNLPWSKVFFVAIFIDLKFIELVVYFFIFDRRYSCTSQFT